MPGSTAIGWTDASWNPVTGCTKVSAGCDHCYAKTFAERFRGVPGHPYEQGFDLRLWPNRLAVPLRWRKPRRVFTNSMSDLFHADVPTQFIASVFAVMAASPRHTFQVLTKRPQRMRRLTTDPAFLDAIEAAAEQIAADLNWCHLNLPEPLPWPLPNVWLGVSVESQEVAWRIDWLATTPAAVRFLSCEPLLGPIDLTPWIGCRHDAASGTGNSDEWECDECGAVYRYVDDPDGRIELCRGYPAPCRRVRRATLPPGRHVDWVITGGESGPQHRPFDPEWARGIRDQCAAAGVPYFHKQNGGHTPRAGGRELDGRTWDQFPRIA
jgi:protein gp37